MTSEPPNISHSYVLLPSRGTVSVSGGDSFSFLQNIISNDLALLATQTTLHACLLSPQGKFLHDFYITRNAESYLLECEGGQRAQDLAHRLSLYKLRSKIIIEIQEQIDVFLTLPERNRVFARPEGDQIPFSVWDTWRIENALPDGSRDAIINVSTLAEMNLDQSLVSYVKGCYVGQELVARMHNRNLGKRHLIPILFMQQPPAFNDFVRIGDETIGEMRSKCDKIGLVLVKKDQMHLLPKNNAGFHYI